LTLALKNLTSEKKYLKTSKLGRNNNRAVPEVKFRVEAPS
jgi:hypothetical protein